MNKRDKVILGIMGAFVIGSVSLMGMLFTVDPVSLKQNQFTYELHSEIPTTAENYINANPRVLEDAVVNLSNVRIDEVGVYDAYAEYAGKVYPFTIQIRDSVAPLASLVQTKYEIKVGSTLIAKDLVKDIEDDSEYQVYFDEEGHPQAKTFTEIGTFNEVFIIVEDIYGNKSNKLRLSVEVSKDEDGPVFSGVDNKIIQVGTPFNAYLGVRASDQTDGDLTNSIQVSGSVDIYTVGEYTLTYTVSDLAGNQTVATRVITVQKEAVETENSIQDVADGPYLPIEKARQLDSTYLTISKATFKGTNTLELVQQMTNHLVKYTQYLPSNQGGPYIDSSYGAICDNVASDQGFARGFLYMANQQDIEAYYVQGTFNGSPWAWNIVKIGESYYHLDITYQRRMKTGFKLYSTEEMETQGYQFDESYYPQCTKSFIA